MTGPNETYRWFSHNASPHQMAIYEFRAGQEKPDPERRVILSQEETTLLQRVLHETATRVPSDQYGPTMSVILAGFYHHQRRTPIGQPSTTEPAAARETQT